jgi:hypothetical protein
MKHLLLAGLAIAGLATTQAHAGNQKPEAAAAPHDGCPEPLAREPGPLPQHREPPARVRPFPARPRRRQQHQPDAPPKTGTLKGHGSRRVIGPGCIRR